MKPNARLLVNILLIMTFCFLKAQGQSSSTYVYINPIYCFPAASNQVFETTVQRGGVTYSQGVYGSFGSGFSIQGGVGKMLNNNFGVELAGEWHQGRKLYESADSEEDSAQGSQSQQINGFMLKPMIILRNSGDLLTFYSKLGLAVSVYSRGYTEASIVLINSGQSNLLNISEETKINASVGFTAAFGISFRVSQSIAITGEVNGQLLSLPETSGYYTKYNLNGQNQLPNISTSIKSWNYEKSVSTAAGDPYKPSTRLYAPQNFSYIGISVGARYYF